MTSPGGKVTSLAYHLAKRVNKAEELTHFSLQILGSPFVTNKKFTDLLIIFGVTFVQCEPTNINLLYWWISMMTVFEVDGLAHRKSNFDRMFMVVSTYFCH